MLIPIMDLRLIPTALCIKHNIYLPLIFSYEDTRSSLLNPEAFVALQPTVFYPSNDDHL